MSTITALVLMTIVCREVDAAYDAGWLLAQLPRRQNLALLSMQIFVATWIFVLGSCFGSFLNVVIYRLPAGMSLGKPKSRCPRCETPLAARDNIPVFGWMLLKGKCRYCSLPIALRYPVIEATCGLIFLALMFGELLTGAANLPLRHPDHFHVHPDFWLVWFAKWDLSGIYAFHCCMLVVTLATVMIGYDGHKPQRKLIVFSLLVAVICGTMWPNLRPVNAALWPVGVTRIQTGFVWQDFMDPPNQYWTGVTLVGFLDSLAGIVGGLVFGVMVFWATSDSRSKTSVWPATLLSAFVIAGSFLGWQASGMLAILMLPVVGGTKLTAKMSQKCCPQFQVVRLLGPVFFVMLFAFLLTWKQLYSVLWKIGITGWSFAGLLQPQDWLPAIAGTAVVAALLHMIPMSEVAVVADKRVLVELKDQIESTSPNTTES